MTPTAIHGNRDMKLMCQMPYLAYLCPLKGDRPDNFNPKKDQDKELFEDFDGTNFIWASQAQVSESLERHRLLATTNVPGQYHSRFILFQSSMGNLIKGKWHQLETSMKRFPLNLISECFTDEIEAKVKERITQAATYGHKELKLFEAREELAVIGVICGTYFNKARDLSDHCDTMHGVPTSHFE